MSSDTISRVVMLREFLVGEGWIASDVIRESQGIVLFTHPGHERRQLSLPVDETRYSDWSDLCDIAVAKVADMTGRTVEEVAAKAALPPHGPKAQGRKRMWRRPAAVVFLVTAVSFAAGMHLRSSVSGPPISISLAGCIDSNGAATLDNMAHDARAGFADPADRARNFVWTRWRALQAATTAEEMRRCYLEAQSISSGFDPRGLIGEDMRRIEDGVKIVYSSIGATLVPGGEPETEEHRKRVLATYTEASAAGERISVRLGDIVSRWYF